MKTWKKWVVRGIIMAVGLVVGKLLQTWLGSVVVRDMDIGFVVGVFVGSVR